MVALSGGVDSALAMALLKQEGTDMRAAYMKTWMNEEGIDVFGDCPWHQDIIDASACAEKLGVEFEVADMIEAYRKQIVEYLVEEYRRGRTPNPDVMCNRRMKFGSFGVRKVARLRQGGYRPLLLPARQPRRHARPHGGRRPGQRPVVLPLHDFPGAAHASGISDRLAPEKPGPRARAPQRASQRRKKDSQGICFLGKIRIQDF